MSAKVSLGAWLTVSVIFAVLYLADAASFGQARTAKELAAGFQKAVGDKASGWDCLVSAAKVVPDGAGPTPAQLVSLLQAAVRCAGPLAPTVLGAGLSGLATLVLDIVAGGAATVWAGLEGALRTAVGADTTTWRLTRQLGVADSDPRAWPISPGQIGPVKVGMTGQELAAAGYARPYTGLCNERWVETDALSKAGIRFEFRFGANADDLDQITVGSTSATTPRPVSRGVGLGSTPDAIRAAYGADLHEAVLNGGEDMLNNMGAVFGPGGALIYYLRGVTYPTGPNAPVTELQLTPGTSMAQLGFLGSGC